MGLVTNLAELTGPSNEALGIVQDYIDALNGTTTHNGQMLQLMLGNIKAIYISVLEQKKAVYYRRSSAAKSYAIGTKYLTRVRAGGRELQLAYQGASSARKLIALTLLGPACDTIGAVHLHQNSYSLLDEVTIRGGGGGETRSCYFTYHQAPPGRSGMDAWGYANGDATTKGVTDFGALYPFIFVPPLNTAAMQDSLQDDREDCYRSGAPDILRAKRHSLKTIRSSTGGEVHLDYELNEVRQFSRNIDYGGIRLKSLVMKDGMGGTDSVHYHYVDETGAGTGSLVVTGLHNGYTLEYDEIQSMDAVAASGPDHVLTGRIQDDGMAILVSHNNGLMYSYVREERVGQGGSAFYFHVPQNVPASIDSLPTEFAYWQYGLPLGRVDYDAAGRIVNLLRNRYYASSSPSLVSSTPPGYVVEEGNPFPFLASTSRLQLQPFGFYMNEIDMENDYKQREQTLLYSVDMEAYYIRPYEDIYLPNIAPRANVRVPDRWYRLYLGGKVVLKSTEQLVPDYDPSATAERTPAYADLFDTSADGNYRSSVTTYHYGPNHVYPVRVSVTRGDGDQLDSYTRRVADVVTSTTAFPVLHAMKDSNVVAPVVVEQNYLTRDGSSYLLGERVTSYREMTADGSQAYLPGEVREARLAEPVAVASLPGTGSVSTIYSADTSGQERTVQNYTRLLEGWRIADSRSRAASRQVVYDAADGSAILQAENAPSGSVAAVDFYRVLTYPDEERDWIRRGFSLPSVPARDSLAGLVAGFLQYNDTIQKQEPTWTDDFYFSEFFQLLPRFAELLASHPEYASLREDRDTIVKYRSVLEAAYTDFATRMEGQVYGVDWTEYISMASYLLEAAATINDRNYRFWDAPGDPDGAGFNLSMTLRVTPGSTRRFFLHVVMKSYTTGKVNVTCQARHADGTISTLTPSLSLTRGPWMHLVAEVDLANLSNTSVVTSLEVRVPNYDDYKEGEARGTALAVLVPAGIRFEAVSRDRHGKVFCTLEGTGEYTRFTRDGLGRETARHDGRDNTTRTLEYHDGE